MGKDPSVPKSEKAHYAGILPQKGWPQRNYRFWRHRLVPGMFQKCAGTIYTPVLEPPAQGRVRITWIGHASFLVQFADHGVMIDPNWAKWHGIVKRQIAPGLKLNEVPELDLVMVSHAHFDHLHKPSLKVLQSRKGIIVPRGSASLVRKLGYPSVHEVKVWDHLEFGDISVVHTPSHHWGARFLHDTHRDYGGYLVDAGGITVFHCGDSAYFPGFQEIGKRLRVDVALMPIGAYDAPSGRDVHMNPEEAVRAFMEMEGKVLIPMHYGTFPLGNEPLHEPVERLLAEADRQGISDRILIPEAGVGIEWEKIDEPPHPVVLEHPGEE